MADISPSPLFPAPLGAARGRLLRPGFTAALLAPAALLALAACGSGVTASGAATSTLASPSAQDLQTVRAAATSGLSESADFTVGLNGATVFGRSRSVSGSGSFDFRSGTGTVSLTPAGTSSTEPLVFTPEAVYIRPPEPGESLPRGKSWIAAGLADTRTLNTNLPGFVTEVESLNPALTLSEIRWAATAAARSGSDTVRGQRAARYDVRVDLEKALADTSGPTQVPLAVALKAEIKASNASGASAGRAQIDVRTWLSDSGRLLRVRLTPPGAGVGEMTLDLTGFGVAVHPAVPPADQITDVGAITPAAERENANGGDSDGA